MTAQILNNLLPQRLRGVPGKIRLSFLSRTLSQRGFSPNETTIITTKAENPRRYKYCYPYEIGIKKIADLVNAHEGPTVIVIEGSMGAGKTHLTKRLITGKDLQIPADEILFLHEDGFTFEYEECELNRLTKEFTDLLQEGKKIFIYDGHCFVRGVRGEIGVFERARENLKGFNVLRIEVRTVLSKTGEFLTKDGNFMPPVTFGDPRGKEKIASLVRLIKITNNPFLQFAQD